MSYCAAEDVTRLLAAYDLTGTWATAALLKDRANEVLPRAKAVVDSVAGRDFDHHDDASLSVDGSGTNKLFLRPHGVWPIISVSALTVSDVSVTTTEVAVYEEEGYIRLKGGAEVYEFPAGLQNVEITLDWGYAQPPQDVVAAQEQIAAAMILGSVRGEASGGTQSKRLGDFQITYGVTSPYEKTIKDWLDSAEALLMNHRGLGTAA